MGDNFVRGISGGQKKRVTTGEVVQSTPAMFDVVLAQEACLSAGSCPGRDS